MKYESEPTLGSSPFLVNWRTEARSPEPQLSDDHREHLVATKAREIKARKLRGL